MLQVVNSCVQWTLSVNQDYNMPETGFQNVLFVGEEELPWNNIADIQVSEELFFPMLCPCTRHEIARAHKQLSAAVFVTVLGLGRSFGCAFGIT
jgi:hypothetical protein